jgi:hypothetical protein
VNRYVLTAWGRVDTLQPEADRLEKAYTDLIVQGAIPRLGEGRATAGSLDPNAGREPRRGNRAHRASAARMGKR